MFSIELQFIDKNDICVNHQSFTNNILSFGFSLDIGMYNIHV